MLENVGAAVTATVGEGADPVTTMFDPAVMPVNVPVPQAAATVDSNPAVDACTQLPLVRAESVTLENVGAAVTATVGDGALPVTTMLDPAVIPVSVPPPEHPVVVRFIEPSVQTDDDAVRYGMFTKPPVVIAMASVAPLLMTKWIAFKVFVPRTRSPVLAVRNVAFGR
jgi:hypothetical protein